MTYEESLTAFKDELTALLALDEDPVVAAVQAYESASVRAFLDTTGPVRWTFGGKVSRHGNVVSMSPNRSETHVRAGGSWVDRGSFPADADTVTI